MMDHVNILLTVHGLQMLMPGVSTINMSDSYGDGWGHGNVFVKVLMVKIFTLQRIWNSGTTTACLEDGCYWFNMIDSASTFMMLNQLMGVLDGRW